ncbi:5-methylcytosine-specific restriction endonuclease system specificity protein McrC [Planococcus shenhongbingii]|uniref:5-methylcytosine-specific restriction endonuclease system specificity protein McrC n=1 Tax=Planococcus shenhongbingii TaxID=3058398 RepID=UPI002601C4E7|nr:5-methylcytosine-specific restriction endonuclease system specificity protein McrC [Planococcus sp. N016]WKA58293.1 5-methylcytosine-specific restriction endonuclease system specificity protein McrC [Planococcus sp. N016]
MIRLKNIYHMLAYAYRILNEEGYKSIQTEKFKNIHDLMAAILIQGVASQCKRGLHKEYIEQTEATGSLRGKIDVTSSIKQNTLIRRSMVCRFDNFSKNILMNQIVKTTMQLLMRSKEVKDSNRKELRKLVLFFENVDAIDPQSINWSALSYHRNNATYKLLLNICQLVINGLLMTTDSGEYKMKQFLDDQQMHSLYEKFLLSYFKKEHPEYSASASYIDWNIDDGIKEFLPAMKTDITLSKKDEVLIIDAKYYGRTMQTHTLFNNKTINSANLYQMYTYVKNKDRTGSGNVSGLILYAKTDEEVTPNNEYQIDGNRIMVRTLDLGADWPEIVRQLDSIPLLIS